MYFHTVKWFGYDNVQRFPNSTSEFILELSVSELIQMWAQEIKMKIILRKIQFTKIFN